MQKKILFLCFIMHSMMPMTQASLLEIKISSDTFSNLDIYSTLYKTSLVLAGLITTKNLYNFYSWYRFNKDLEEEVYKNNYSIREFEKDFNKYKVFMKLTKNDKGFMKKICTDNYEALEYRATIDKKTPRDDAVKMLTRTCVSEILNKEDGLNNKSRVICDNSGNPQGFIMYCEDIYADPQGFRTMNQIETVAIKLDHHRKKLGSILINSVVKELTVKKFFPDTVIVEVYKKNKIARNCFEKNGFKEYNRNLDGYLIYMSRSPSVLEYLYLKLMGTNN